MYMVILCICTQVQAQTPMRRTRVLLACAANRDKRAHLQVHPHWTRLQCLLTVTSCTFWDGVSVSNYVPNWSWSWVTKYSENHAVAAGPSSGEDNLGMKFYSRTQVEGAKKKRPKEVRLGWASSTKARGKSDFTQLPPHYCSPCATVTLSTRSFNPRYWFLWGT